MVSGERELIAVPRIALLRSVMLNHWYHHRGQLVGLSAGARRAGAVDLRAERRRESVCLTAGTIPGQANGDSHGPTQIPHDGRRGAAYFRVAARPGASRPVELGSIDGSVGGNNFTPAQFLDYLSSIKLTWAMISLPAGDARRRAAIRQIRDHADRLGIKLQLAHGSVCPSVAVVQRQARHARRASERGRSRRRRSSARRACAASSAAIPSGRRSRCTSTTWSRPSAACARASSTRA